MEKNILTRVSIVTLLTCLIIAAVYLLSKTTQPNSGTFLPSPSAVTTNNDTFLMGSQVYTHTAPHFRIRYPSRFTLIQKDSSVVLHTQSQDLFIEWAPIYPAPEIVGACTGTFIDSYQWQRNMLASSSVGNVFWDGFAYTDPGIGYSRIFTNSHDVKFAVGIDGCFASNPIEGTSQPKRRFVGVAFAGNTRFSFVMIPVTLTEQENALPHLDEDVLAGVYTGEIQPQFNEFLGVLQTFEEVF